MRIVCVAACDGQEVGVGSLPEVGYLEARVGETIDVLHPSTGHKRNRYPSCFAWEFCCEPNSLVNS